MRWSAFLTLFLFGMQLCRSQDTIEVKHLQVTDNQFAAFYPSTGSTLAALTKNGSVYKINLDDLSVWRVGSLRATALGCDRKGMMWAIDSFQRLFKWVDTGWAFQKNIIATAWEFAFNRNNDLFLLTDMGIYDDRSGMYYATNKNPLGARYSLQPATFFIDDEDAIWIVNNYRWGKFMLRFSTRDKTYWSANDIKMFTRDLIEMAAGPTKVHFMMCSRMFGESAIRSFTQKGSDLLYKNKYDASRDTIPVDQEYLGAGWFDWEKQELYYFSSKGVQKAGYDAGKNKLMEPVTLFPSPSYRNRLNSHDLSFPMQVKSLYPHKAAIVFLHKMDGLFVYKNGQLFNLH